MRTPKVAYLAQGQQVVVQEEEEARGGQARCVGSPSPTSKHRRASRGSKPARWRQLQHGCLYSCQTDWAELGSPLPARRLLPPAAPLTPSAPLEPGQASPAAREREAPARNSAPAARPDGGSRWGGPGGGGGCPSLEVSQVGLQRAPRLRSAPQECSLGGKPCPAGAVQLQVTEGNAEDLCKGACGSPQTPCQPGKGPGR